MSSPTPPRDQQCAAARLRRRDKDFRRAIGKAATTHRRALPWEMRTEDPSRGLALLASGTKPDKIFKRNVSETMSLSAANNCRKIFKRNAIAGLHLSNCADLDADVMGEAGCPAWPCCY